jgi:hypothetical protein
VDFKDTHAMLNSQFSRCSLSFTVPAPSDPLDTASRYSNERTARVECSTRFDHFACRRAMMSFDPAQWSKFRVVQYGLAPDRCRGVSAPPAADLGLLFAVRQAAPQEFGALFAIPGRTRDTGVLPTGRADGAARARADAETLRIGEILPMDGFAQGIMGILSGQARPSCAALAWKALPGIEVESAPWERGARESM